MEEMEMEEFPEGEKDKCDEILYQCSICDLKCNSERQYTEHLHSKKHGQKKKENGKY